MSTLAVIGTQELLIVAIIGLVLFGGSQLPKLARNLGRAQKELQKGLAEGQADACYFSRPTTHSFGVTGNVSTATPSVRTSLSLGTLATTRRTRRIPGSDPGSPKRDNDPDA